MEKKTKYITKSRLKSERGWSDGAIERLLGECDRTADNPHYRSAAPMRLYSLERVERAERAEKFQHFKEAKERRREAGIRGAETKREALWNRIDSLTVVVPRIEDYLQKACDHYNDLWERRGRYDKHAFLGDGEAFLERIAVNYIRHEVSDYEERLRSVYAEVGADEARLLIAGKVLDAIAEAYPELAEECARQKEAKWMAC